MSGVSDLNFVIRSVHELIRIVTAAECEEDPTLLVDIFSLPAPPEDDQAARTRQPDSGDQTGTQTTELDEFPGPTLQPFRLQKVRGGFSIVRGNKAAAIPALLEIQVAYDVRRGNPLAKYHPADFELDKRPIKLKPKPRGIRVLECTGNSILAQVIKPDFSLHVTGFDENRDLYVKVTPRERSDASSKV
ncbi:MAG TPA: hypothetical protein EYP14_19310 [Planctomycetaceae bacterium]|nr:hypothetical protein [Planctomycetaceae bacterium]